MLKIYKLKSFLNLVYLNEIWIVITTLSNVLIKSN